MTEVSFLASVAPEKFRCKDPSWSFIATLRMTNKLYHIVQVELYFVLFLPRMLLWKRSVHQSFLKIAVDGFVPSNMRRWISVYGGRNMIFRAL